MRKFISLSQSGAYVRLQHCQLCRICKTSTLTVMSICIVSASIHEQISLSNLACSILNNKFLNFYSRMAGPSLYSQHNFISNFKWCHRDCCLLMPSFYRGWAENFNSHPIMDTNIEIDNFTLQETSCYSLIPWQGQTRATVSAFCRRIL